MNGLGNVGTSQLMSEGVVGTAKKPSVGLDPKREVVLDTRRTSYLSGFTSIAGWLRETRRRIASSRDPQRLGCRQASCSL